MLKRPCRPWERGCIRYSILGTRSRWTQCQSFKFVQGLLIDGDTWGGSKSGCRLAWEGPHSGTRCGKSWGPCRNPRGHHAWLHYIRWGTIPRRCKT